MHVYVALLESTPTNTGVVGLVALAKAPKSLDVHDAPKPVIGEPPSSSGACTFTTALPAPGMTESMDGAPGTVLPGGGAAPAPGT